MASSPLKSKAQYHARSISLPSTISHPLIPQFNQHLRRALASETTSSSLSSINTSVCGLQDLYDCVDDLLLLPHIQQAFAREAHQKWADEALDGYIRLLDVCATTKDVCSQSRQNVQELLSILRRRRDAIDFGGYLASSKRVKKAVHKCMKDLKGIKNKPTLLALDKEHETMAIFSILNEAEAATLDVLESLLYCIMGKVKSRPNRWDLVSKLMHNRRVTARENEKTEVNEFEMVDLELHSLIGHKTGKYNNMMMQDRLGKMEQSIEGVEAGIECLFRRLIKIRVSLLNLLNS